MQQQARLFGMDLKWIALAALILQNSGIAITMRYSLLNKAPEDKYIASTAVLMSEVIKLIISSALCYLLDAKGSMKDFQSILNIEGRSDVGKLCVPSILYTLQNSLQYISMANLSAPVFQVLYQMKIITTAVFSVMMLSRKILATQWISIIALTSGVALVQLSQQEGGGGGDGQNSFVGLVSVLCGCLTSGFAGVYFEMVLKASSASIWLRNIQLSVIGIVLSTAACFLRDSDALTQRGFFVGYGVDVWSVILLQAAGGMIVATVVKYADNVLKGFATSVSIILSAVWSAALFNDVEINSGFLVGAAVVISAVFGFSHQPSPAKLAVDILPSKSQST
jgi:UDP-galactose transporter